MASALMHEGLFKILLMRSTCSAHFFRIAFLSYVRRVDSSALKSGI